MIVLYDHQTDDASLEFSYVENAARGIVQAAERCNKLDPVNLGAGRKITIQELVDPIEDPNRILRGDSRGRLISRKG